MAGYEQTALVLPEMRREQAETGLAAVVDLLVEHYRISPDLKDCVAHLEFDSSNEWTRTLPIDHGGKSIEELIADYRWVRISGDIPINRKMHGFEMYFYPVSTTGDRVGLLLRLEASAYLAVYGERPSYYGLFDEEARDGLISLCLGVTDAYGGDGFVYDYDSGKLTRLTVEDLTQRLLHPILDTVGKRPGLITGIRKSMIAKSDLELIWGPENIKETTTGYVCLALMRPDKQPSAWAVGKLGSEDQGGS